MNWPRTLYGKLLLLFLAFGAIMTLGFIAVMRISHETYHLEFDQTTNRELARQYVAANLLVPEPPLTAHNFANALRRLTEINPYIDAYVLDARGEILAASARKMPLARVRVAPEPIRAFLGGQASLPILGEDPTESQQRKVFSAAPLSIPDCTAAYLYLILHGRDHGTGTRQLRASYSINEGVGIILLAGLLAVAGSMLFLRLLTRRLAVLQKDMEHFRDDQLAELPVGEAHGSALPDEIERLRGLFVQLARRIRRQMQELQRTDEVRRDLLANLSHDLRTPLATLQAHLETLALNRDMPAEERDTYLSISVRQTRRLIRLVEQLLELATLEAHQVSITREPCQLAELAYDVVMKFEAVARREHLALRVEHPEDIPLVSADIALIERVLDNLLENALRHSPPGAQVTVRLSPRPGTLRVEVHNDGPAIPEAERERIFDRFYRGDKSRSTSSGHSGLGLSIVCSILELHGTSIDLVSDPVEGTTFFFELALAAASTPSAERTGELA